MFSGQRIHILTNVSLYIKKDAIMNVLSLPINVLIAIFFLVITFNSFSP